MVLLKLLLSNGSRKLRHCRVSFAQDFNKGTLCALMSSQAVCRQSLSKALELVTMGPVQLTPRPPVTLVTDKPRPLVVMLAWMLAKKKHIDKYCDFYLGRGCDVLTVRITPWQLLWPVKGSQLIAEELLQFLHHNTSCQPLFLHGFSVGAYVWGEVLVKMNQEKHSYQPIIDRIVGQTWDSATDVTELKVGLPLAVFPRNPILRMALAKYIEYHLNAYNLEATTHFVRASQIFHTDPVRCPTLLLLSKADPVGSITANLRAKETWESLDMKVTWQCWNDSKHVSHYLKYKEEYIKVLEHFLDSLDKQKVKKDLREKLQAKL